MRNADLVRLYPNLAQLRRELAERKRKHVLEARAIEKLEDQVRTLGLISEIRDKVALREDFGLIRAVGDEISRGAEVYQNVNDRRTWGLRTYEDTFGRRGEHWHGVDFTRAEANQAAYAWVIKGLLPQARPARRSAKP